MFDTKVEKCDWAHWEDWVGVEPKSAMISVAFLCISLPFLER